MTATALARHDDPLPDLPRTDSAERIFEIAIAQALTGQALALVTLVGVSGRSARNVGAQMIVLGDGRHCGYVAGGCIEKAVAAEAQRAIALGQDRILKLGEGSPFFDIVLPCGGSLELAIQVIADIDPLRAVMAALAARQPAALVLDLGQHSVTAKTGTALTGWDGQRFTRAYQPRTRLIVCGRGLESEALVSLSATSDLDVVCVTPDPITAEHAKAHGAFVHEIVRPSEFRPDLLDAHSGLALLFHDLDWEIGIIESAVASEAYYIGALGSHTTHARRCAALEALGISPASIARIKGPIGAFGPARDARTLATSILADVRATGADIS